MDGRPIRPLRGVAGQSGRGGFARGAAGADPDGRGAAEDLGFSRGGGEIGGGAKTVGRILNLMVASMRKRKRNKDLSNMKIAGYCASFLTICLLGFGHATAQNAEGDRQAIAMLKEFYTDYITAIDHGEQKAWDSLQRKFCTVRLLRKLPQLGEEHDEDPFLKAQDSNIAFLKSLTVKADARMNGHYVVSYMADKKVIVNVMVVRQQGHYLINGLW